MLEGVTIGRSGYHFVSGLHSIVTRDFLTDSQNGKLEILLQEHKVIFEKVTGGCTVAKHRIKIKHAKPIKQRNMPRNPAMMEVINEEVDSLLEGGRVEPFFSPNSSPIVLVVN